MKLKATRKSIVETSTRVVSAGYCDLQNLLINHSPIAYNAGVYGWNFDAYEIDDLTICTGYRNMPGKRANNIREYEERARRILPCENTAMTYDEKRAAVEELLHEFVKQA